MQTLLDKHDGDETKLLTGTYCSTFKFFTKLDVHTIIMYRREKFDFSEFDIYTV